MKKQLLTWNQFKQDLPDHLIRLLSPDPVMDQVHFSGKTSLFQKAHPACDLFVLSSKTLRSLLEQYHTINTIKETYQAFSFSLETFYQAGFAAPAPEGFSALADEIEDLLVEAASPLGLEKADWEPVSCNYPPSDFPGLVEAFQALYPFSEDPAETDALFRWTEVHAPELSFPGNPSDRTVPWLRAFCGFGSALLSGRTDRIQRTFIILQELYEKTCV